ncbi:hypothetical protein [Dysgonomonas macrotermitis]|uniref:Uncharacterized protein n=1 Tax=Dysgonomonas macrotermitis TaxID=1346286 RepID=A0A1M5EGD4_9BACT|nr:hypothetical protein [Dysgonomonas macrotermitis]SHF78204.1 hypothetical protein SAMN05444362_11025 [Dysgonomonas macrotermitis]
MKNFPDSSKTYRVLFSFLLLFACVSLSGQIHTDQNGIKTSVLYAISANQAQARRFEVATIGYNSYHWQSTGILIVELFNSHYGTGYEKYTVEIGYSQGAQGDPVVKLIDSQGMYHYAKVTLGEPYDLSTSYNNQKNRAIPVYVDVKYHSTYKVRLTYLRARVNDVTTLNQIKIHETPTPIDIPDFTIPTTLDNHIRVAGTGDHYITNGNVGIGTSTPKEKLDVAGTIRAKEVKVEINAGADYVFDKDYDLKPLSAIEEFVSENKHLPEIPSEKEMQEDGLSVNEFQIKLLKKIEELTLYIIEQDKAMKTQNKNIERLQQELDKLKQ